MDTCKNINPKQTMAACYATAPGNDLRLYANPYQYDAQGFYFSSVEEYNTKYAREFKRASVEEYEIQFIDGDNDQCQFAKLFSMDQCNISQWFEQIEEYEQLEEYEKIAINYLMDYNALTFTESLEKHSDLVVFEGRPVDYAQEYISDCYDLEKIMGPLHYYFDFDQFARDCICDGDWIEYGKYTIAGINGI